MNILSIGRSHRKWKNGAKYFVNIPVTFLTWFTAIGNSFAFATFCVGETGANDAIFGSLN